MTMADSPCKATDPRVLRTRQLLQQALEKLLETRAFEELSVQDITDAATLNRATFYAHYPDKEALLQCLVAGRFHALMARRGVMFDGTCLSAVRAIVVGVCDFLAETCGPGDAPPRRIEPPMESAIIAVVREMILHGLKQHPAGDPASPEVLAGMVSWAIYGGAKEWVQTPGHGPSEETVDAVMRLAAPILRPARAWDAAPAAFMPSRP